jgi:hypothetical protein
MPDSLTRAVAIFLVGSALSVASTGIASAQDTDAIRGKCISDAMKAYSDPDLVAHQTARTQLYITCMRNHGLTP